MKYWVVILTITLSCTKEAVDTYDEDLNLGGATSITGSYINIFQQPAPNLSSLELEMHRKSDVAFGDIFVTAPSIINGGLGPVFNQNSCENCHVSNGRSVFPQDFSDTKGLLLKLSIDGSTANGAPLAVPHFGTQLQTKAIYGKSKEAAISWYDEMTTIQYTDGHSVVISKPIFSIKSPYMPLPSSYKVSPRIAPPMIGLGLLEAVNDQDILSLADENDSNNDGISGKANVVWDYATNMPALGRFGWKAGQPTLIQQTAGAYNEDMGITSPYFIKESCEGQIQYDNMNDEAEIDQATLEAATFYPASLAVPQRRNVNDATVIKGKQLFFNLQCQSCHNPKFKTGHSSPHGFLNNQTIYPYTDMLLHDMGNGLADERPEFNANGKEWRTTPLWGIGLTKVVGGPYANYLHDGRAKTLEEAILWHGGEAQKSKENFINLSKSDRNALIKFIESL